MLKKRLVGTLIVKNGIVVQSIAFRRYLPIGRVSVAVEFLNQWGIDEIIVLDIDAQRRGAGPDVERIAEASRRCMVPLTVGGGIRSLDDMKRLIHSGADKVAINHAALSSPTLIEEGASVFGSQCIVVSIDAQRRPGGGYEVAADGARNGTGLDPAAWARTVAARGAGEVLITSVERDGSKQGYELPLVQAVADSAGIPVIACGGAGRPQHFLEVLGLPNVSAAAAGNYFHFTEHSVSTAKAYLLGHGLDIRLDTYADYRRRAFDDQGRVAKRSDAELAEFIFEFVPDERI